MRSGTCLSALETEHTSGSNQTMVAAEITKGIIERIARSDIGLSRAGIRELAQFGGSLGIAGQLTHLSF